MNAKVNDGCIIRFLQNLFDLVDLEHICEWGEIASLSTHQKQARRPGYVTTNRPTDRPTDRPTRIDRRSPLDIRRCYGGADDGGSNTSVAAPRRPDSALRFFMDRWEGWPRRQKDGRRNRETEAAARTKAFL